MAIKLLPAHPKMVRVTRSDGTIDGEATQRSIDDLERRMKAVEDAIRVLQIAANEETAA